MGPLDRALGLEIPGRVQWEPLEVSGPGPGPGAIGHALTPVLMKFALSFLFWTYFTDNSNWVQRLVTTQVPTSKLLMTFHVSQPAWSLEFQFVESEGA
jgi:hypothetical protein